MLPVYIYYSMFGFQRVGDLIWAAGDQRARGFLLGATAGRTTLGGEGLQHQDGSSHLVAATVPNCRAYDPAFAGELAVILDHGARGACWSSSDDEFYYVTVMNENYAQPSLPEAAHADLLRGMYRFQQSPLARQPLDPADIRLLGSGSILREVLAAAELLASDWQVGADVFSVTSFSELAREAREAQRAQRLGRGDGSCHLTRLLGGAAPVLAATDYVRAWPQLIAEYVDAPFSSLGTDGFGRSDTRQKLRRFFEVDRHQIVLAALQALARQGSVSPDCPAEARRRYGVRDPELAPWSG
jgi:pyruvate dehydrogenase E1 component